MSSVDDRSLIRPRVHLAGPSPHPWRYVLLGPVAGAALGVVARWWMRLISDDPEFSWSGTIFIVLAFTVSGTAHGIAWGVRRAGASRRWTTPVRIVAAIFTLPIFSGAGAIMLPTVLGATVARSRTDWPRFVRVFFIVLAIPAPVVIAAGLVGNGLTAQSVLGAVLLAATYAVIIVSTGAIVAPIDDGLRLRRSVKVLAVVAPLVLVFLAVASSIGVG